MDLVFKFSADPHKNTNILVLVDRFSKMIHLVAVPESINASACACVFTHTVFRLHVLRRQLVSDRDSRFTADFWRSVFKRLGTRLEMSTTDHAETDGQTERANRVLEEILRGHVQFLRIGANYCRRWNSPRTTRYTCRRCTRRSS